MPDSNPQTGPRHEPDRVHERAADPAEAAGLPLEPKSAQVPLKATDEPDPAEEPADPHHVLNTPVGEPDPTADSDPYRRATPEDEADRAGSTPGSGQGAEE
jgi:hypothetical protein